MDAVIEPVRVADPVGRPVGRVEQAHLPGRGGTPRRRIAVGVPDAHLPPDLFPRAQRLTRIGNPRRLAGRDLAGVPEISRARAAPGPDLVGGLDEIPAVQL